MEIYRTTVNGVVLDPPSTPHPHSEIELRAGNAMRETYETNRETYKRIGERQQIYGETISQDGRRNLAKNISLPLNGHLQQIRAASLEQGIYQPVPRPYAGQQPVNRHRFGPPDLRSSYNERTGRHRTNNPPPVRTAPDDLVYRSNGGLDQELDMVQEVMSNVVPSGRGFHGSHGAIDVMARQQRQTLNMFPDVHSFDSGSMDGPAAVSTLQRKTETLNRSEDSATTGSVMSADESPKQKKKNGFFSTTKETKTNQKSLFKKLRGGSNAKDHHQPHDGLVKHSGADSLEDHFELDRHRRRFFAHHDIVSVCASLSTLTQQRSLERRNTTTGASAASAALRNANRMEDGEKDLGDNVCNELVLSCPYFRNEIGGETERKVVLTRQNSTDSLTSTSSLTSGGDHHHTPGMARGFSLLDTWETNWHQGFCPYKRITSNVIERVDQGASFYKNYFYGKEHQNWFGIDETLGPIAISIRRERVTSALSLGHTPLTSMTSIDLMSSENQFMYRLLVRTSELLPLRGCVLEESIPSLKAEKIKTMPTKEVLEFVCPELQLSSLHLAIMPGPCEEELVRLDEAYMQDKYKVGMMYCREGQQTEEEMYNNEEGGAAFNEFLDLIGQRVRLKGFNKYKAGLCNKNDSTGLYSVYSSTANGTEIMFHVSTLLPYTPNNRQQLPRKRYIGNDIVTVVFQEPGALPFIPNIKSQFQHVFIVVRAHNPCSENTQYSVAVSRSKSVPTFGPPLPPGARFAKSKAFADFLVAKIINAENAAHRSDKFVSMAIRTRQELLKDLATNYVTQTTLDSGSKFNIFSKKKDKIRPRFSPDTSFLRGALSWRVVIEDCSRQTSSVTSSLTSSVAKKGLNAELEAFVAISPDTLVILQDNYHHDVLFITSTKSVIGWTAGQSSIRIYVHQGEAIIIHSKDLDTDDMSEISQRLKSVSSGTATQEFTLRRNQMGQLGFHVQHDGIITEVENFGYAWQTGLRQGSRLVEINKHPVTALSHEQMVELLKTSMTVTVTVIPPFPDGTPRKGCHLKKCPMENKDNFSSGANSTGTNSDIDGDYENVNDKVASGQQPVKAKTIMEGKPGYMEGNKSGYVEGRKYGGNPEDSGRWYEPSSTENSPPPPLPTRLKEKMASNSNSNSSSKTPSPSIYQHPPPPRVKQQTSSNYATPSNFINGNSSATVKIVGSNAQVSTNSQSGYGGYQGMNKTYQTPPASIYQPIPQNPASFHPNSVNYPQHNQLEEKRSGDAKVTYLTEYELNQPSNNPYLQHERLAAIKSSTKPPYAVDTGHTTDSSSNSDGRPVTLGATNRSEDELSASSSSHSPQHSRRVRNPPVGGNNTSSSNSGSRNQSPRTILKPSEVTGEGQVLHQAVKKRPVGRNNANRNSASLAGSSTLQEDLMKLISPDYDDINVQKTLHHTTSVSIGTGSQTNLNMSSSNSSSPSNLKSRARSSNELSQMTKAKSRDNLSEVSYHLARPATVLSNASLSSASSANTSARSERTLSTQTTPHNKSVPNGSDLPLPDDRRMDWTSLVDTATKAINQPDTKTTSQPVISKKSMVLLNNSEEQDRIQRERLQQHRRSGESPTINNVNNNNEGDLTRDSPPITDERLVSLIQKVNDLETRLNTESAQKMQLQDQVATLRQENDRLQEESNTASQQLKRFTEWFFQTIDKA